MAVNQNFPPKYDLYDSDGEERGEGHPLIDDEYNDADYHTLYGYRWFVLSAVFFLNLVNAALWLTYSPITDLVHEKYDVPESVVNVLSLCMSGLYGPVVWTAAPLVKKYGLAHSVRVAAVMTAAGAIVRAAGQSHRTFALLVVGQCLSGVGRPIISQLLGLVSLNWFGSKERVLATAIAALGNPFGIGAGFVLSPLITNKDPDNIIKLNYITAIIGIVMAIYACIIIRERPKTDPSDAATAAREKPTDIKTEIGYLRNSQYWLLATCFGLGFGQCNAVAIILNQLLKPFGYDHKSVGFTGVMTILPGVVGASLVAGFLGKRPWHREVLIAIYIIGGGFMQAIVWLACRTGLGQNNPFLLISAALFGFFAQPCFSVALELASETVFPASPSTAGAGVIMMAQYVGLAVSAGFGYYIDSASESGMDDKRDRVHVTGCVMSGGWLLAGILMLLFRKDNMLRMQYEIVESEKRTASRKASPTIPSALASPVNDPAGTPSPMLQPGRSPMRSPMRSPYPMPTPDFRPSVKSPNNGPRTYQAVSPVPPGYGVEGTDV